MKELQAAGTDVAMESADVVLMKSAADDIVAAIELVELSILEDAPEQVIQLNFQLFPLTRSEGTHDA